ncbi:hypothetical protein QYE76_052842 [Lolium multiflorum]|uniref:Uncharacterized protein n=1 Tax=Lolium multiflorum TaxID=4521 RepID=A0AAD8SWC1_LOLMU|nr:hypothetical protein QYE76_052842 [Lolium multiflorum]
MQRRLSRPIIFSKAKTLSLSAGEMDMENANPIVHDAVGSKRDASLFDVVPSKAVAAAGGGRIPPGWDPYEPVPYISPPNPYDTCMDDPWNEVPILPEASGTPESHQEGLWAQDDRVARPGLARGLWCGGPGPPRLPFRLFKGLLERDIFDLFLPEFDKPWLSGSDVGSDDEHHDVKTRQVLRRLQVGQYVSYFAKGVYRCPFCTRRLGRTDFNCLLTHAENIGNTNPKVGASVNPHSFRAKHMALGMHLRSIQRVEISAGRMPPLKPKAPKGSNKWRQRDGEAAPTIDTTVAILMEKNEELSLECDRLRDDLAAKKKNSKTLVELICSLRNERDMLKNELIKQKERNIASAEKASSILKTVCLERDKSDIEYKILLQDKVQLQKLNLEYADIAILALLERQKAQDKLMHLMLESCSEREETLKEVSSLVGYMSDVGRTSQNPPRLSSNSSGTSFQQCMLGAPTTSTH